MSGKPILNNASSFWNGTTILSEADTFALALEMSKNGELSNKNVQLYMALGLPYADLANYNGRTMFDFYCFMLTKWFGNGSRTVGQLASALRPLSLNAVADAIQTLDEQGKLGNASRAARDMGVQSVEPPDSSSTANANAPIPRITVPSSTIVGISPSSQNNLLPISALNHVRVDGFYLGSSLTRTAEFGPIQEHIIPNFPGRMTTQEVIHSNGSKHYLAKAELKDGRTEEFLSPYDPGHAINVLLGKIGIFS